MAVMTRTITGNKGGGITLEVGTGSTGADITVQSPEGGTATVFTGGASMLALAGQCAAIAQGVNNGPLVQPLYAGYVDYGTSREGEMTLTPTEDGGVTVELKLASGPRVECDVDLSDVALLGQLLGAASHDL